MTMSSDERSQSVLRALAAVLGPQPAALHAPQFLGNEAAYLQQCLDSTYVSSVGPFVDRFEQDLARVTGAAHVVAVVNGTAALHVALRLAGVVPGDQVLVPTLTFVATANAVAYCGATPHFVDSAEATLGMDPIALRAHLDQITERRHGKSFDRATGACLRAIVPMHTFGHPVDMDRLLAVGRDFGITIVEDAAESLGSTIRGRHTGTMGLLGTLSFNGNKTITTGGGGAILTNDAALAARAKHLTTTAKRPHRWEFAHDEVGYNYRLPSLNAALGCAQLERLPQILAEKRRLFARYQGAFRTATGVELFEEPAGCHSNYWLQTLILHRSDDAELELAARDAVLAATNDAGYMTRPAWGLMHRQAAFTGCPAAPLPVAESLARRIINIPSSSGLA